MPPAEVVVAHFLPDVHALHRILVEYKTIGARTEGATFDVAALTELANVGVHYALVYVFAVAGVWTELVALRARAHVRAHHVGALTRGRTN